MMRSDLELIEFKEGIEILRTKAGDFTINLGVVDVSKSELRIYVLDSTWATHYDDHVLTPFTAVRSFSNMDELKEYVFQDIGSTKYTKPSDPDMGDVFIYKIMDIPICGYFQFPFLFFDETSKWETHF